MLSHLAVFSLYMHPEYFTLEIYNCFSFLYVTAWTSYYGHPSIIKSDESLGDAWENHNFKKKIFSSLDQLHCPEELIDTVLKVIYIYISLQKIIFLMTKPHFMFFILLQMPLSLKLVFVVVPFLFQCNHIHSLFSRASKHIF